MTSLSIQARVDGKLWAQIRRADETNTQTLQRVVTHYAATHDDDRLGEIAATPAAAMAVLFYSYELLWRLTQNSAIALPERSNIQTSEPVTAQLPEPSTRPDDDW